MAFSSTHENVSCAACIPDHQENANSQMTLYSLPAKHMASFQRPGGHSNSSCPLPTHPSPSTSFPLNLIVIKGRRQGGKILLAAPANGESRRTTPIPCWLPHLSPSSSPAKAHFPLASRCELLGCPSHAYALTRAHGQSTVVSRAIPLLHALVLTSGTHQ